MTLSKSNIENKVGAVPDWGMSEKDKPQVIEIDYEVLGSTLYGDIYSRSKEGHDLKDSVELTLLEFCELANVDTKGKPFTAMGEEIKIDVLVERTNGVTHEPEYFYKPTTLWNIVDGMNHKDVDAVILKAHEAGIYSPEKTVAA